MTKRTHATPAPKHGKRHADPPEPAVVVNVSLLDPIEDYDEHVTFLGRDVRILRLGTGRRVDEAEALVAKWAGQADAIAVTGLREARATGRHEGDLGRIERLRRRSGRRPDHGRHNAAQRAPGVGRPPRPDRDARVLHQRAGRRPRAARTTSRRRGSCATTPTTSPSPIPRSSTCVSGLESVPVLGRAASTRPVAGPPCCPTAVQSLLPTPGPVANAFAHRAARECDVVVATYEELDRLRCRRTCTARPSSPRRSRTSGWPNSPPATSTWCSTARPSRSISSSSRRCSRR